MSRVDSSEYPDDYIEIVNEINDFIASLTGSPADASASSGTGSQISHCEEACRDSVENDYEPIESIIPLPQYVAHYNPTPPPPPPIRPKFIKMSEGMPKHVKAVHNFKGSNNDELCFCKGDIITVTQALEEGWWEGTLNGKTGWFPSNYVKEVKAACVPEIAMRTPGAEVPQFKRESMQLYHSVVLKNIIETEKTHVSGMSQILQTYILPLQNAGILTPVEYCQLVGNIEQLIAFQHNFLASLEECEKLPPMQRRIGGVFMKHAEQLKRLYMDYCGNHPKAVSVLQIHREDLSRFMESVGATPPGAMTLTTNLSKPFTRLDRYPSLLKELERHIEESHPDRGDTQRAIAVYRDIANSCLEVRKLKEMELEIVTSTIAGWEGESIASLGEVVHLSQVKLHKQTGEKHDRIFVLFPNVLLMLSMSPRLSGYQYEGKLPLSGMTVNRCEDLEAYPNGFEISGNMIEKMVVTCGTKVEVGPWLDTLRQQVNQTYHSSSTKPQSLQISISTSQPSISTVKTQAKTAQVMQSHVHHSPPHHKPVHKTWSMSCLRPSPPLRPALMCRDEALKSPKANRKSTAKRKPVRTGSGDDYDDAWHRYDQKVYNEDAFILQVIEAYCNSAKTRHTVNSYVLSSPHVLIPDHEKIFDETDFQEKTLVDTVYSLKDKVKELEQEQKKLKKDVEDERKARRRLENVVHKSMGSRLLDSVNTESVS
ncbi:rho guanine nucleotide exchange factor 7-like isoform X3 [Haliotis rufescens]|uniref:rho guanine nucleotide exchange factor 7-like isoform X3 n=1 Tax=Haliotis rufescens TaxID=6454 RepID=UPI00201EBB37|nr:rho guanine nucleotide exchange factor 7-like isoform X3 [Haliotis rufescens]